MSSKAALKLLALLMLLASIAWISFYYRHQFSVDAIQIAIKRLGIWAPLGFILLYALATVLFLPGAILTLAGGFLFGPLWGSVINLCGATIGATGSFIIARYIASDWVANLQSRYVQTAVKGVENEGWRFVMVVRLVPLIPFNALNYVLGLTKLRLFDYIWASFVFMSPGAIGYTYIGSLGKTALAGEMQALLVQALIAMGIVVLLIAIPIFVKRWHDNEAQ